MPGYRRGERYGEMAVVGKPEEEDEHAGHHHGDAH
jgi:hypothetical protein